MLITSCQAVGSGVAGTPSDRIVSVPPTGPDPLPPVERLRPGLTSVPVPLPNNSLRYVFVYVFESEGGVYLVDAGWNTDDAYQALEAGLAFAGYAMSDVRGVMVTHIHPDHYGLAGRIREASGAWISLHPADAPDVPYRPGPPPSGPTGSPVPGWSSTSTWRPSTTASTTCTRRSGCHRE